MLLQTIGCNKSCKDESLFDKKDKQLPTLFLMRFCLPFFFFLKKKKDFAQFNNAKQPYNLIEVFQITIKGHGGMRNFAERVYQVVGF